MRLDEKQKSVVLTEDGTEKAERMLEEAGLIEGRNLYDIANTQVVHHLNQSLKANVMFKRDTDYIVKDGKVVIIDEFTGRMMDGRRWSDGLHQAVEAKEGVEIEAENQTLASITFQNYFRMYPKLSGMTGTALTEAPEFFDIYKMNVVSIPTNVPVKRIDEDDEFYKNITDKFAAIAKEIRGRQEKGQPVLVGTVSIEKSEMLSEFLEREGIKHSVLNARFHESEAHIVAQAGRLGAVTIATNMAGRGTDIQLGGNLDFRMLDEFPDLVVGTPEYEAQAEKIRAEIAEEKQRALDIGRPVRARHRAPREPAHRQPASRPLRPSGRPRPVALLSQPRRRPSAHLRPADHVRAADEQEPRGWRSDHQPVDLEGDRDRAEEGRGPQLRHPQAGRRIRRRDERPAQGHLRAALRHHGCRGRQRRRRRHARGNGRLAGHCALPARHLSGAVGRRGPEGEHRRDLRPAAAGR